MNWIKIILALLLAFPCAANATTYWVSSDGAAAWESCVGSKSLSGASACSVATMNSGAMSAGDTVYFRAGTYSYSTLNGSHISLSSKNGSSGSMITLMPYNNEVVVFSGTYGTRMWGLNISGSSYIKFSGLVFQDYTDYMLRNSSHHIEFDTCTFKNVTSPYRNGSLYINEDCGGGSSYRCPSSHIWVHGCTFYKLNAGGGCTTTISEGGDAFRIGYPSNICSPTEIGTSATELTIEVAEKTFTTQAGMSLSVGDRVKLYYDASNYIVGEITAYTDTSMTIDVKFIGGSGTYSSWSIRNCVAGQNSNITFENNYMAYSGHAVLDTYSKQSVFRNNVAHNEPWYPADNGECTVTYSPTYTNSAYDNLYSHRVWQITDTFQSTARYNLFEGNRLGHAGVNPNNDGATGLTIASPGNIIRFNSTYGAMHNPMKTKYGTSYGWQGNGAQNCKIYNNTLFKGGYGYPYFQTCTNPPNGTCPKPLIGFRFYAPNVQPGLAFKNNIVVGSYGATVNGSEDIQDDSSTGISFANNFCTNADAGKCTQTGDPKFVDTTLTSTTSLTLPNLKLQFGSGAIKTGTSLTLANGAGTGSTSLTVDDALYFQAGSAAATTPIGSSLSSIAGDYILINGQVRQITDINYTTNVLTLDSAATWADDAPVYLYKKSDGVQVSYGGTMDIGAEPFTGNASVGTGAGFSLGVGAGISVR